MSRGATEPGPSRRYGGAFLAALATAVLSLGALPACVSCTGANAARVCELSPPRPGERPQPPEIVRRGEGLTGMPVRVPPPLPPAVADSARREMRTALAVVAAAQDRMYRVEGRYSFDARQLVAELGAAMPAGVYVQVVRAGARGWAGRAEHILLPARTCVLWAGDADDASVITTAFERRRGDARPGRPVCDGDDEPPAGSAASGRTRE
jgi:hypothetical protein